MSEPALFPFPKIFALGTNYVRDIFADEVEVTEKVDGSQFVFGKLGGRVLIRSKGAVIHPEAPPKMFREGVDYVRSLDLDDGVVYFCEYLQKPKHNVLAYSRTPTNNLCLFAVWEQGRGFLGDREELVAHACALDIDPVPLLRRGRVESIDDLRGFLELESYLGGAKVEGVVVKNYSRPFLLGGQPIPVMAGKFVSEAFKEVHRGTWKAEHTPRGKWDTFVEGYRTEARWAKAVQRLRESGQLTGTPQDIGRLIAEVKRDVVEEERAEIERFLWREFAPQVTRRAVSGLPEWYRGQLAAQSFNGTEESTAA